MKQLTFVGFKKRGILYNAWKIVLLPYTIIKTIICIVISPAVIMYDLLPGHNGVGKTWALYLLILSIVPVIVSSCLWEHYTNKTDEIISIVTTYSRISNTKQNIKDVPYQELINLYASQYDLDPALVAAVIKEESSFDPEAISPAGARGLMQITPKTWRYLTQNSLCNGNHAPPSCGPRCIFDPEANIRAGTKYLSKLLNDFNGNAVTVLAAYNAGRGNIKKYGEKDRGFLPNFPETQNYVKDVLALWVQTRQGLPPIDTTPLDTYKNINTKLYILSFVLWMLLAVWILFKSHKITVHTFRF